MTNNLPLDGSPFRNSLDHLELFLLLLVYCLCVLVNKFVHCLFKKNKQTIFYQKNPDHVMTKAAQQDDNFKTQNDALTKNQRLKRNIRRGVLNINFDRTRSKFS